MKHLICSLLGLATLNVSAASYTLSLPTGVSLIANHLNAPGGNTLNNILPNPPPGTTFYKWNCTAWTAYVFDDIDFVWYPDGLATLNPGEGALIDVPIPTTITFTGTPVVPVLPVTLPCGCNQTNLLSGQTTNAPSTFQDVTGFAPADGTSLTRINGGVSAVYTFSGGVWSPGAPLLNQGEAAFIYFPCAQTNAAAQKWLQVPDTTMNGLDVKATTPKILADDFLCTATGPITQVRIWGSWRFDLIPPLTLGPCFNLGIWTDIPTNVNQGIPYSRPGQQLCNFAFPPGSYTGLVYTNGVQEQFFDPNIPAVIGFDTVIWEYVFDLTNFPPCWQTNGNIYWLSVQADCFHTNNFLFGWKTCRTNWNDDAVFGDSPFFGAPPPFWMELRRPPYYTNSLDLAFEVITSQTNQPPRPPTNTVAQKWLQIPDTSMNGLDVKATHPKILADDFLCTATGPITQIRIWTSWLFDLLPPQPPCFSLGIWSDIPADTNLLFHSRPGAQLCTWQFLPGTYTNYLYTNGVQELFFDPNIPAIIGSDTMIWEYVFDLPTNNPCWQTNGNIYWLSVQADCFDTNQFLFGWKTCPTNWNDDAVFGDSPFFGAPPPFWMELRRPPYFTNSLDLAFEIITSPTNQPPPPTNNIGQKWLQIPDTTPNGIDVHINDWSMLADDFRCTATGPITEVRIWGSWLNDVVWTNPCFCIGLWTDIPVSPTNPYPYSLPGQLLCETCFYPGQYTNYLYTNVYWEQFWDPWNPISGLTDSQVWEYVFSIPTNSCWWQTNGNTYWLSVRIPPGCFDPLQYQFGWKTCPTNWNDDAVYGYSPGSNWQELRRPPYYTNSLDLAFEIITGQSNPCPPGVTLTCGPDHVFECGTNWTVAPPIVTSPCCGTNYTLTYSTVTNGTCPWVITYTWQVVDCAGNTATCTHTVTIVDTTKPVLTCAPNKTVQCTDLWSFDPPTAYDICCGTNVTITILNTVTSGICPQLITRHWQATDCCSNFTVCAQSVTVTDTNPPAILCPSNILVWTCSTNVPVFWTNTAMNLCSSVTITSTPPSGTLFNRDTTNLVTVTATDACSNSTSCTFEVVVRRPSLTISIGGSPAVITIAWPDGGILQYATNLTSPITWTSLPLATSPHTVSPFAAQRFYRLRCP